MHRTLSAFVATILISAAAASQTPPELDVVRVADDLDRPLALAFPHDASGRLFVAEQSGRILVWNGVELLAEPLLDLSGEVAVGAELGLLGLATHPDFATNGWMFVNYVSGGPPYVTHVVRYTISADEPNRLDPDSAETILQVPQNANRHHGGHLAFGPIDGHLYIGLGDDAFGPSAQDLGRLQGKMLRIDVDSGLPYTVPQDNPYVAGSGRDEIWAYGLRNPWRYSFDRATGDLFIADVGQSTWEEIDYQPAFSPGGENYGWDCFEGEHPYPGGSTCAGPTVPPVIEYSHQGGCAVLGGYVYRGSITGLVGRYLYADMCNNTIFAADRSPDGSWTSEAVLETDLRMITFGEDEAGEIWIGDFFGGVHRLVDRLEGDPPPPSGAWLTSLDFPDFRFKLRITNQQGEELEVRQEQACLPETLCLSGAVPGRAEIFVRIVGPKPNGFLWSNLIKFSTSTAELWIEQLSSRQVRYYRLDGVSPGSDELDGLVDRLAFEP